MADDNDGAVVETDAEAAMETTAADPNAETTTDERTVTGQSEDAGLVKSDPGTDTDSTRELVGMTSDRDALLRQIQDLRVEKRTLGGEAKETETVAANTAGDYLAQLEQELVTKHVAPLQAKLGEIEKAHEKTAIAEFSSSDDFPLIHKAKDSNNQGWNKMMQYYVARRGKSSKESIKADLEDAYWATFGKEHVKLAAQQAKFQGMAEATANNRADIGTGKGVPKKAAVQLSPQQKEVAKKMGMTDEQYVEGMKLRGDL